MGFSDVFKKKKKKEFDPLNDAVLWKMKKGWMVDYDSSTWEVIAFNTYDWGGGEISREWQINCGDETLYLEVEGEDEFEWCLNTKIRVSDIGDDLVEYIIEAEDPPDEIEYDGVRYYLEESSAGHYFKDGKGDGEPLLQWCYEDDEGELYLTVEQYGEEEFEAATGIPVEEYMFTNVLPVNEE